MLSCRRATEIASAGRDRPLTFRERWSLRAHALICSSCRRALRQFKRMQALVEPGDGAIDPILDAMPGHGPATGLSPEQRARIAGAIPSDAEAPLD